jgi:hypothetical protein
MGFNPKMWGSRAWHFIHFVALAYPENPTQEIRDKYYEFYKSIGNVLPCPACAENYRAKFDYIPPDLENSEKLFQWTVDIHNLVNRENQKPELSYEEAKAIYLKKNEFNPIAISLFSAVVVMACAFLIKKK